MWVQYLDVRLLNAGILLTLGWQEYCERQLFMLHTLIVSLSVMTFGGIYLPRCYWVGFVNLGVLQLQQKYMQILMQQRLNEEQDYLNL